MPRIIVHIILYIPNLCKSPLKRGCNAILIDLLTEKISKLIGYEATAADVSYALKVFQTTGLKLKFKGYNDKLNQFIYQFLKIMRNLAE